MSTFPAARAFSISRREALGAFCAMAAMRKAHAAEPSLLQPVTVDHINLRVADVARSAAFYSNLFGGPPLRVASIAANPTSPAGEAFYMKVGDSYVVVSPLFPPDGPGLDHICFGIGNYRAETVRATLQASSITLLPIAVPLPGADVWIRDSDGLFVQLRSPGGWTRLVTGRGAAPQDGITRSEPAFNALGVRRIAMRVKDVKRSAEYYGRLFGTEIGSRPSSPSRTFAIGDSLLELAPVDKRLSPSTRGLDYIEIAVKDFTAESARRILSQRGIAIRDTGGPESVRIRDPDGLEIRITAMRLRIPPVERSSVRGP